MSHAHSAQSSRARSSRGHQSPTKSNRVIPIIATVLVSLIVVSTVVWFRSEPDPATLLARELQSDDADDRYGAAKDLEELGPEAVAAVDELALALSDKVLKVRYRAAKTLSKIGPPAAAAVPALADALSDPERDVRYYAAKALYKIDDDADDALNQVIEVLDKGEPDPEVRRFLVKTLAEIGERSEEAHRVVKKLVKDRDERVREEVAEALEEFQEN